MSQIINILCAKLPGEITRPMYREYERFQNEIVRILDMPGCNYSMLRKYDQVVYSLLGLSFYYRYVIGSLDGARNMYYFLNKGKNQTCPIRIGDYIFDKQQYNKMLGVIINLEHFMRTFQLDSRFFEFTDPLGFLRNCKELFYKTEYAEGKPL